MTENLITAVKLLAKERKAIEAKKELAADLDIQIQQTPLYKQYIEVKSKLTEMTRQSELTDLSIRETAFALYDGENKTIVDQVKIVDTKEVEFFDEAKIIAWASKHNQESLSYKKASIKKIVKGGGMNVDGTRIVEGNAVRIASDLSAYLPSEEPTDETV